MTKRIVTGILAHVDAGKTTCIENMLFQAGEIRKIGRVDHKDAFLDYDAEERNHGITIYAKEAFLKWNENEIYIIDTPGHADFSSEMERSLGVLDLAVVLINGQDGVQSHTETIWKCLAYYHVPTLIFVNKMDISYREKNALIEDIQKQLSEKALYWEDAALDEKLAMVNDELLEQYLENEKVLFSSVQKAHQNREVFPIIFGSALHGEGIRQLLDLITEITPEKAYPDEFGARVYKISSDEQNNRLVHIKVTGGTLQAKQKLSENEKVDQIRIYSGRQFHMADHAEAGMVCVLKGLHEAVIGQGFGFESNQEQSVLQAFMAYDIVVPEGVNLLEFNRVLKKLAEQDPQLRVETDEKTQRIRIQIMGEMQKEILQKKIYEECGITAGFFEGRILYRETIRNEVIGSGHFEPLRHYAEVHVRLSPLQRGSGIIIANECPPDTLSSGFQKSILDALERKRHRGVLTGSLLTDVKITLIAAKGHIKHTVGGDFREASSRAVRQGLLKAESIILEPYYAFTLRIPSEHLSYALYDLEKREASVEVESDTEGKITVIGKGPVRTLANYQNEVVAYTKGKGLFFYEQSGYEEAKDQKAVIADCGYDPQLDFRNSGDSVFCANGSGYIVPWDKADDYMHIDLHKTDPAGVIQPNLKVRIREDELSGILEKASGNNKNMSKQNQNARQKKKEKPYRTQEKQLPPCLIVDGYNVIYDWDELSSLAREDLYNARERLLDVIGEYHAYTRQKTVVVFDGYQVKDNYGTKTEKDGLTIVYTKYQETADAYIEKLTYELKDAYTMTVASSDGLVQNAIMAHGALRISARQLKNMIEAMKQIAAG